MEINKEISKKANNIMASRRKKRDAQLEYDEYVDTCTCADICPKCGKAVIEIYRKRKKWFLSWGDEGGYECPSCGWNNIREIHWDTD